MSDNVTELPIRFKEQSDQMLVDAGPQIVGKTKCRHSGKLLIDPALAYVECGDCGAHLNPMLVLNRLAREETHWHRNRERYQDEMRRLNERCRTKCQHCGEMTRISGR